jgi:hypothetical protein
MAAFARRAVLEAARAKIVACGMDPSRLPPARDVAERDEQTVAARPRS